MTKKSNEFLKLDKEYVATLKLGYTSTTGDPEGEITEYIQSTKPVKIEEHKDKIYDFVAEGAKQCDKISDLSHREASETCNFGSHRISVGDAVVYKWEQPIDAVACEGYLGKPMSKIPSEMELKKQKQECREIVLGFLKNLVGQIKVGTPVTIAVPAWLRENGEYSRLDILDEIIKLGYNVNNKSREGLLYHRKEQIVARDILILRKK